MIDCGYDGMEDLPMNYPECCSKHLKEARKYCLESFENESENILKKNWS